MKNGQDKLDKLLNITDEYNVDPHLAERTINTIRQKDVKAKNKISPLKWLSLAACCVIIISISVLFPVYFSSQPSVIYYTPSSLEFTEVDDIEQFREDSNLNFRYLSENVNSSRVISVIETGETAYIIQDAVYVDQTDFDMVTLYIVVMPNAEFDFYREYDDAVNLMTVSDLNVYYFEIASGGLITYRVRFSYENVDYYMSIQTSEDSLDTVVQYVNLLIN